MAHGCPNEVVMVFLLALSPLLKVEQYGVKTGWTSSPVTNKDTFRTPDKDYQDDHDILGMACQSR